MYLLSVYLFSRSALQLGSLDITIQTHSIPLIIATDISHMSVEEEGGEI